MAISRVSSRVERTHTHNACVQALQEVKRAPSRPGVQDNLFYLLSLHTTCSAKLASDLRKLGDRRLTLLAFTCRPSAGLSKGYNGGSFVNLPSTIVFRNGRPTAWYVTCSPVVAVCCMSPTPWCAGTFPCVGSCSVAKMPCKSCASMHPRPTHVMLLQLGNAGRRGCVVAQAAAGHFEVCGLPRLGHRGGDDVQA